MNGGHKFNSQSARLAIQKRWDSEQQLFEQSAQQFTERETGHPAGLPEADQFIFNEPLFQACRAGNVAALKLYAVRRRLLGDTPATTIRANVVQIANVYDRDTLQWLSNSPDEIQRLLDTGDWTDAEELRAYAQELVNGSD